MISIEKLFAELKNYAEVIKNNYSSRIAADPEDQLKRPVCDLLENFYPTKIETRTETQVEGLGGKPDIGVGREQLLIGHVELKAPGKGANTIRFTGADKTQWEKFKKLPNLIYTDGEEWALYRTGGRTDTIVRFSGDILENGAEAITISDTEKLYNLFSDFFSWQPIVPDHPKSLAEMLAPLCWLLREDVEQAASLDDSNISILFRDWRRLFFPDADTHQFADAYAQTLTYSMLLARLSGADRINPEEAARKLDSGHGLLAQTLRLLGDKEARKEISTAVDVLERVIQSVDAEKLSKHGDTWIYFYEDFLAAYDPKLRKDSGVYYTPNEVIGCQVRLCAQLLEEKFGKHLNYADEGVTFLDPAAGTAAYPLAAIQHGLETVASKYGEGMIASKASEMARNFYAFEYMVGPYAVAHLRITTLLKDAGADIPKDGIRVYLTDTLEDPNSDPPRFGFAERQIAEEHNRAQKVKRDTRILVCMGNPPYDREQREEGETETRRKGAWIRFGSNRANNTRTEGILKDFIEGAPGIHVKNLYNDYVYFWRWALWKLYENGHSSGPAILSFITASSYLRGPGFVTMRRKLRETFDELWIIDLEGDNLGARKTENVFNIQIPVSIAIGVRYGKSHSETPAICRYSKITGSRTEKLLKLNEINGFKELDWKLCFSDWEKPLLPEGEGDYFSWPLVTNIFPWQNSGVKVGRTWPIGCDKNILEVRWKRLTNASSDSKTRLFKNSPTGRKINQSARSLFNDRILSSILEIGNEYEIIEPIIYSYRNFDRQWIIPDSRVIDRPARQLWTSYSKSQIYLVSLLTGVIGEGPSAGITCFIPDKHFFRGSYGGKDIIPLWRNQTANLPNLTSGISDLLAQIHQRSIIPEDIFAYTSSILGCRRYAERFSEELTIPGPRIPITKDPILFSKALQYGRRLIWLHTYGERFIPKGSDLGQIPQGSARCNKGIPSSPECYPENFEYFEEIQLLRVGEGEIQPVAPEIWNFSVSGLQVVKSWLDYRKKTGAGRRSSPLDDIHPERWTTAMTQELLNLIWILEHTISMYPELEKNLDDIVQSECFTESEFPLPRDEERQPLGATPLFD